MSLYNELAQAISEILNSSNESEEFKQRFSKLIENFFDNSYQDSDISELINLIQLPGEFSDEI